MHAPGLRRAVHAACRRARALLLACAALGALAARVPAQLSAAHHFPAHAPADIAHSLADFSNQPDVSSWRVEEEHSNYTTWRYSVRFACGPRCAGRAAVRAHDDPSAAGPAHGRAARRHRVSLVRRDCTALPLLPWPTFCDEHEITAVVSGSAGGGAQLQEESRTRCGALRWLSGACARGLRERWGRRLARLRALPPAPASIIN